MLGAHTFGGRDPLGCHYARATADAPLTAGVLEAALRVVSDGVDAELRKHRESA